ncbi:MAG: precorrin-6A reductase [Methanomassiliicoccaceae archaeon]|nr:precorrin-6A reductase [Methanomassiliicoccaceae archaeon]
MTDILIFGGTTEGRLLSETLADHGLKVYLCVATEYGERLMRKHKNITISGERLDEGGMTDLIRKEGIRTAVDATHPYAVAVSGNIKRACAASGAEYIRLLRPPSRTGGDVTIVNNVAEAVEYLKGTSGNVLAATGSKELDKFTSIDGYADRIFARVLPLPDVMEHCAGLGFRGRNLICMQGPFNEDINYGMMKQFRIKYMVTKDSGDPGGFGDKMRAASRAGVHTILVGRPPETGSSYDSVVEDISKRFGLKIKKSAKKDVKKKVWVIGMGMGGPEGMTMEAVEACRNADVIIGPKRMTEAAGAGKNVLNEYKPEKIVPYIRGHPEFRNIAIVFSGDIGFYSGAKNIIESADPDWNIVPVCGIPSVVYLCSKLMVPWQDVRLVNAHAAEPNTVGEIRRHRKVFSILTRGTDINALCKKLMMYGLSDIEITVGENLGYPDERITQGCPRDLLKKEFGDLSVILAVNGNADAGCPISIPDTEFIRGDVPMTKSEIRTLTVGKLKLRDDSVVYDVGAGTGSVSVEIARVAVNGKVYAIEAEKDALGLIQKNKVRFGTDNIEVIEGRAPDALADLPAPTHVFIGGSGGSLKEIMSAVTEKNPNVTMIVNSVTIETACDVLRCIRELGLEETETLCISVSKARATESAHLMIAQNPIYMTVCGGRK